MAISTLNKLLEKDMFDINAHLSRAKILFQMKQYDKVLSNVSSISGMFPSNVDLLVLKGEAQVMMGEHTEAQLSFSRAEFINPTRFRELKA